MNTGSNRQYSVADYFELEEGSEEKYDYHDGKVFCVSGGTAEHSAIIVNVIASVGNALKGSQCRVYESSLRVGDGVQPRFVHPDVHIICGPVRYDLRDPTHGTVLNPTVVIEVLSRTNQAYEREFKFEFYREFEAIREYVLVSQCEPAIQMFHRQGKGDWVIATERGLDARLALRTLNLAIPFGDIYDSVAFPPSEDEL